ncbi:MAG: EAL domain-containing protein [Pseudomonadota bacterium]
MQTQNLNVLILDDDPDDAFLVQDQFMDMADGGYTVEIAHNWDIARHDLKAGDFDVLLCDYRLGAISGLEVIEMIRAEGIDLPVILLTGVGTPELDNRALEAGAADFLAKDELSPTLIDRTIRYAMAAIERQRLLQAVLDAAGAAVMLLDEHGDVVLANAVARQLSAETGGDVETQLQELARRSLDHKDDEVRLACRVMDRSTTPFGNDQKLLVLQDVTDRARILEERERSERRLYQAARHDALTGLGNRVAFTEAVEEWTLRAKTRQERFAMLSLDLDRFKEINDVYGHAAGDELLYAAARRLRGACGNDVFIARLGGDEFVVMAHVRGDGTADALALADSLRVALSSPYTLSDKTVACETSVGIALFPDHGSDEDTLIANADLAMYRAKAMPLVSYCMFDEKMDEAIRSDRALSSELREAIDTNGLDIHVQPQTSLHDRCLTGFEALARWTRREGGTVSPDRFIKVAERSGLILSLGEHLMRRSLNEASLWKCGAKIAVNVSPVQVNHCDLPGLLREAMLNQNISPCQLEIEITETALLEHTDRALHALRQIRAMGISIALDDFGTGYSSLAMLQSFPFDKVKIDKSFIMDLDRHGNQAIVRSIAQLGENLGIKVLCEGVETEENARIVHELGCSEMQGYLLSKPMPATLADTWAMEYQQQLQAVA